MNDNEISFISTHKKIWLKNSGYSYSVNNVSNQYVCVPRRSY